MSHTHDIDFKNDFTITKQDGSVVEISGEIPFAELQKERSAAIAELGKNIKVDGFREGHVPEDILAQQLGEMTILTEMAERALRHCYTHIIDAHEIDAIGQPSVNITKLAPDNPLGFTATVAVVPDITLPDYRDIAANTNKEKPETLVTDEDVATQIKDIMRQKAAYERMQKSAAEGVEAEATDLPTPESEAAKAAEAAEPDLADLTDEYVKTLGQPGQFTSVEDFTSKVREHVAAEKEREARANHRARLTDAIVEKSTLELPQLLINSELDQMFAQMSEELTRAGLNMEDYLSHIKKTKEELRSEWQPAAEKRAKLQLILNEIAKAEAVSPDPDELQTQVQQLLSQYPDADESRVRVYVASVLVNEAVMNYLETIGVDTQSQD